MCIVLRYHTHYLCLLCVASSAVSDGLGINRTVLTGDWRATICSWSSYMGHCKNNAHLNFVTKVHFLTEKLTCLQHSAWWLFGKPCIPANRFSLLTRVRVIQCVVIASPQTSGSSRWIGNVSLPHCCSDFWISLLSGALCSVHVSLCMLLYARKKLPQ
jgi:hypothetical protein